MKKSYIQPSIEVIKVNPTCMLMSSGNKDVTMNDETINTDTEQFSREDNTPNNPNIWDQSW